MNNFTSNQSFGKKNLIRPIFLTLPTCLLKVKLATYTSPNDSKERIKHHINEIKYFDIQEYTFINLDYQNHQQ